MNELKLTAEQRKRIAPWENHLHRAFYADYVTALPSGAARDLFDVYNAVYHANEQNKQCHACQLNVCKRLGRLYYAEEIAKETPASPEKTAEVKQPAPEKKTPAKGKKGGKNGKK